MYFNLAFLLLLSVQVNYGEDECNRPVNLTEYEDKCLEGTSTFFERIQHKASGYLNLAKQKLGIEFETRKDSQKCDYYLCIFQKMMVVDGYDLVQTEKLKSWIAENVPGPNGGKFTPIDKCFNSALKGIGTIFKGDANETEVHMHVNSEAVMVSNPETIGRQSSCDTSLELMKCLHTEDKCSTFKYP